MKISLFGEPEKWNVPAESWNGILEEYAEQSGNKTMSKVFILTRQITFLRDRLRIIQLIINQLAVGRNEAYIKLLQNDLGFRLKFDDLEKDLPRVVSLSKPLSIKLKQAEAQYEALKKDEKTSTEADWDDELAQLGKFQTFRIDKKSTTVSEYLAIKKAFKVHVEIMSK